MKSLLVLLLFFIIEVRYIKVFLIIPDNKDNRDRCFSLNNFQFN